MLPSPSTFYPEFYGNLPSAGTSGNLRSGFSGMMNGTPVVARADEVSGGGGGFGGGGYTGEKRRSTSDEVTQGASKRARS